MREATLLSSTMPVLLPCGDQEDCSWRSYVFFLLVRHDSFAAKNEENLLVIMHMYLRSGARRKSDDRNRRLLCPDLFVYERPHADSSAFENAANSVLGMSFVNVDRFQRHHVLPLFGLIDFFFLYMGLVVRTDIHSFSRHSARR